MLFRWLWSWRNRQPADAFRRVNTLAKHHSHLFRNLALVAHIDSGKTTLTESILLKSSYLSVSGSVDTGSTTTDFLPAERERGITIQSASIPVQWKHWTFNLIDTPGHADFGMEVECASRVIDGAVVLIDSVKGVESQTKGVWAQLDRYNVKSRIVFLNKLDRPGSDFTFSVQSLLQHKLHPRPAILTLPVASFDPKVYQMAEPGIQGIVDLVQWEVLKYTTDGLFQRYPLPRQQDKLKKLDSFDPSHPIIPHLIPSRVQLLDSLAMLDEKLMDMLLEADPGYLTVDQPSILASLRRLTLSGSILPITCGSAVKHIGTDTLLDYCGHLLPSPKDIMPGLENQPLRLLAWKVGWDKNKGWMTYVRVYSGTLTRRGTLFNVNRDQREKVTKIMLLYASQVEDIDALPCGSVGVIMGLKYTKTGDTLVSSDGPESSRTLMQDIRTPTPVVAASVIPRSHADLTPVQEALDSLCRTDPSASFDNQDGQILVHGLGVLHLEIIERRLRDEWGVAFELGKRRVSYMECLENTRPQSISQAVQVSGNTINVHMEVRAVDENDHLNIEVDPAWQCNIVVDHKGFPYPFPHSLQTHQAHIAAGIWSILSSSPNTSLPMTGVYVRVTDISPLSHVSVLAGASAIALRTLLRNVGVGALQEPYLTFDVDVPAAHLGKVVTDLTGHGGEIEVLGEGSGDFGNVNGFPSDGLYIPPKWLCPSATTERTPSSQPRHFIRAQVPLSRMLDYSNRLRALSEGHGHFKMCNPVFRSVPPERKQEILEEIGRA